MSDAPAIPLGGVPPRRARELVERRRDEFGIDHPVTFLRGVLGVAGAPWRARRAWRLARAADGRARQAAALSAEAFAAHRREIAADLAGGRRSEATIAAALALVREACRRELGIEPYVEQMVAGAGLLMGCAVEMATGEGKTLAAAFPTALQALAGRSVHVVTSNDYLAERDHDLLQPVYRALGLATGLVVHDREPDGRRAAYAADITYVSNKEVAFDYLRDRLIDNTGAGEADLRRKIRRAFGGPAPGGAPVQRGLDVAVVDEADSVLVDDAGTPLLISADGDDELDRAVAERALATARKLCEDGAVLGLQGYGPVELSDEAVRELDDRTAGLAGPWRQRVRREALIVAAVTALHRLHRDRHYIVRDGKIVIIDENTGRTMPDRFWEHDLHSMVECKEGCELSGSRRSLASISFQRFFRRYRTLCGMSGTVTEVARELAAVYRLPLMKVPRRRPLRLVQSGRRIFADRAALWRATADDVRAHADAGRPVLIGVCTVSEAARGSAALTAAGIPHRVLSAAHDRDEAQAIAVAGEGGMVTIATSMAGRGTDIKLGPGVAEAGGLVVLLCERHASRRVDRQLVGRCARQGDPGISVEHLSFDDWTLAQAGAPLRRLARVSSPALAGLAFRVAQRGLERLSARARLGLVRRDEDIERSLGFAGGLD
jgi:preprotein translocase subunit SecA